MGNTLSFQDYADDFLGNDSIGSIPTTSAPKENNGFFGISFEDINDLLNNAVNWTKQGVGIYDTIRSSQDAARSIQQDQQRAAQVPQQPSIYYPALSDFAFKPNWTLVFIGIGAILLAVVLKKVL